MSDDEEHERVRRNAEEAARQAQERAMRDAERLKAEALTGPMKEEMLGQLGLIYGGLILIGVYMVQPFLTAPSLNASAKISIVAFAVAIPLLAALVMVNRQEAFRGRLTPSVTVTVARAVAQAAAFVGIVAGFWHITWIAGVMFLAAGVRRGGDPLGGVLALGGNAGPDVLGPRTAARLTHGGRRSERLLLEGGTGMGSVIYDKSSSLDGFIAGANVRLEAGLGDDGQRLHDWAFEDEAGKEILEREVAQLGAVICGRRTYDMSIQYWGDGGPTGEARVPLFVLSHSVPDDVPEGGVYTFVDDLETALARARETAGDKNTSVMGADVGRQLLNAGAIDEISVHLVPVLFGSGTPLFGEGVDEHVTLEFVGVSESPHATHLRYRVVRDG
jgi:dihydrofolate reductase